MCVCVLLLRVTLFIYLTGEPPKDHESKRVRCWLVDPFRSFAFDYLMRDFMKSRTLKAH